MAGNVAEPLLYSKCFVKLNCIMKKPANISAGVLAAAFMLLITGCATPVDRLESRKMERQKAYDAMPAPVRAAVDQGTLRVGMNEDAAYIAWGKPSQITRGGNESGEYTTWTYRGFQLADVGYWGYRAYHPAYATVEYVSAQVVFVNGAVKSWQIYPRP
jgi:hypothetical protein